MRDVRVGVLSRPQAGLADFYRELGDRPPPIAITPTIAAISATSSGSRIPPQVDQAEAAAEGMRRNR